MIKETIFDKATRVKGIVTTQDNLVIQGILEGSVRSTAKITVDAGGRVIGDLEAKDVEILGTVEGNINANGHFLLGATGRVEGDVVAGHMRVEDGGVLHGTVQTKKSNKQGKPGNKPHG